MEPKSFKRIIAESIAGDSEQEIQKPKSCSLSGVIFRLRRMRRILIVGRRRHQVIYRYNRPRPPRRSKWEKAWIEWKDSEGLG